MQSRRGSCVLKAKTLFQRRRQSGLGLGPARRASPGSASSRRAVGETRPVSRSPARRDSDSAHRLPPPSLRQHPAHALRRAQPKPRLTAHDSGMPGCQWAPVCGPRCTVSPDSPDHPNIRLDAFSWRSPRVGAVPRSAVRPAPGADEGKAGAVGGRCLSGTSRFLRGGASFARRPPGRGRPGQSGRAAPRPLDGPARALLPPWGVSIEWPCQGGLTGDEKPFRCPGRCSARYIRPTAPRYARD